MGFDKSKLMQFPRYVLVGHGVTAQAARLVKDLGVSANVLVVCDEQTLELAGKDVLESLKKDGIEVRHVVVQGATMDSVGRVESALKDMGAEILLGVGGGSVIDVTKLAAHRSRVPYVSVPTSAAHDGIASARASIKEERGNVSKEAKPPDAILADTSVIAKAPHRMLASGCGDVLSNLTALLDWRLAERLKGDEYSSFAAALAETAAQMILEHRDEIKPNREESAWFVVKSLITSGVAMSVAGDSRPASGSEHMISHMLDRVAPGKAMHGEQCGVAAILMMYLHDGDWIRIRDTLKAVGAPTTLKELGIERDVFIQAMTQAHTVRPDRYTILGETGLTPEAAAEILKNTGVG